MPIFRLPRFVRRYLRARMHPMAEEKAWEVKRKLAALYAIIAWNAAGFVFYQIYNGNKHWPITAGIRTPEEDMARPAYQFARSFGIPKADVIRVKGLTDISKKDSITLSEEDMPDYLSKAKTFRPPVVEEETIVG